MGVAAVEPRAPPLSAARVCMGNSSGVALRAPDPQPLHCSQQRGRAPDAAGLPQSNRAPLVDWELRGSRSHGAQAAGPTAPIAFQPDPPSARPSTGPPRPPPPPACSRCGWTSRWGADGVIQPRSVAMPACRERLGRAPLAAGAAAGGAGPAHRQRPRCPALPPPLALPPCRKSSRSGRTA